MSIGIEVQSAAIMSLGFKDITVTVREESVPEKAEEPFDALNHQDHMDGLVMYVTRIWGRIEAAVASGGEPDQPYTDWAQVDVRGADPDSMVQRMVALVLLVQPDHVITEDRACAEILASLGFHVGYDCGHEIGWSDRDPFPGEEPDWEDAWGWDPGLVNWYASTDSQDQPNTDAKAPPEG